MDKYKKIATISLLVSLLSILLVFSIDWFRLFLGEKVIYEKEFTVTKVEKFYHSSSSHKGLGSYQYRVSGVFSDYKTYSFTVKDTNAYRKGKTYIMYSSTGSYWSRYKAAGLKRKPYHIILFGTTLSGGIVSIIFYRRKRPG